MPPPSPPHRVAVLGVALGRILIGATVIFVLLWTYGLSITQDRPSFFDFFGYFTNLTSILTSTILIVTGMLGLRRRPTPGWLVCARAVATSCMLIVAVIYNVLVPGTGSAPPWVSIILHIVFPVLVALDWVTVGDRTSLPWLRLWIVLPYPLLWLIIVLARGATDGWVPYGFLLPSRGMPSLVAHIVGLLASLLAAAALVWISSRLRGCAALLTSDRHTPSLR